MLFRSRFYTARDSRRWEQRFNDPNYADYFNQKQLTNKKFREFIKRDWLYTKAYNPESKRRVLLCSHWDSRPYADAETDEKLQRTPILGVNDGASGVGVLLEVARQLQQQAPLFLKSGLSKG